MTERPHVLLIEGSPSSAHLFCVAAEPTGYEVRHAKTLAEGKEALNGQSVVFCDLHLPDSPPENTIDWLQTVRAPLVVISGTNNREHLKRCARLKLPFLHKVAETDPEALECQIVYSIEIYEHRLKAREILDDVNKRLGLVQQGLATLSEET